MDDSTRCRSSALREQDNVDLTYALPSSQTDRIKRLPSAAARRSLQRSTEPSTAGIEQTAMWVAWNPHEDRMGFSDTASFSVSEVGLLRAIAFSPSNIWKLYVNVPYAAGESWGGSFCPIDYSSFSLLVRKFQELTSAWKSDTTYLSDLTEICDHWAYRQITAMGWPVVPLILRELDSNPDYWFSALQRITGVNPVPTGATGRLEEMASAWLEWAKSIGISW